MTHQAEATRTLRHRATPQKHHLLNEIPLVTLCSVFLLSAACVRVPLERDYDEASPAPREAWALSEEAPEPTPVTGPTPLDGHWLGPLTLGDCIEQGSWLTFDTSRQFRRVAFQTDVCTDEAFYQWNVCEGAWVMEQLATHGQSGVLRYACEVDAPSPAFPDLQQARSSFAIFSPQPGGRRALSFMALEQKGDAEGSWVRHREELTRYPPGPAAPEPQTFRSDALTRLQVSATKTGEILKSYAQIAALLDGAEALQVTLELEIEAEVSLSDAGLTEQGVEAFVLEGRIVREGEARLRLEADLEGESDFVAWDRYLGDAGVKERYLLLGATLSLAFTRTLWLDAEAPRTWRGAESWGEVEELCELYGEVRPELCQ